MLAGVRRNDLEKLREIGRAESRNIGDTPRLGGGVRAQVSVIYPGSFSTAPSCRHSCPAVGCPRLKTIATQVPTDEMFFGQLAEFCRLVQEEFLARFNEIKEIPTSSARAMAFTETLMLCPTREAARACIRRELCAALSFVVAIQAMQHSLQVGKLSLPSESPDYQTPFYLLACAVREYLESLAAPSV